MRTKTKLLLVAVPAVAIITTGAVIAVGIHLHRLRRKKESSFLPHEVRDSLQELCLLKTEDYATDKLGSSLYQRKLESLTDRQLIGVYVIIKAVEVLRNRGVDIHQLTKEDVANEVSMLRSAAHDKHERRELLGLLGSLGADTAKSVLNDGLLLAGMVMQVA